jgi:outer membrane protein OmpA-like peptidoglycan-associated protein
MSLFGDHGRFLTSHEEDLIRNVFKTTALPPLSRVRIRDGESPTGTAITIPLHDLFNIMVGKSLFALDVADADPSTLVHEMTHVWQYFHGTLSRSHALSAHSHRWAAGKLGYRGTNYLYEYDILTDSWNDMGFEGQAQLVEEWFYDGKGDEDKDKRFCFVKKVLYDNNIAARKLNIIDLCDKDFYGPPGPDPDPIRVTQKDDSFVIILDGDVLFDFDKSEIKPEAAKVLDIAAKTIKSVWRDGSFVLVNGYTDNIGSKDYNNGLSERRAQAVAHWFPSRGLPYSVMRPRGFGKTNSAAPNTDQVGRAKNRRVEIFVMRS